MAMHPMSVVLRVADLQTTRDFYVDALGLRVIFESAEEVGLSATGSRPALIVLKLASSPARRLISAPGLFHMALLSPDRGALAGALRRLVMRQYPLEGAADHLVSHALYLADPEGNGIEIYYDLPREKWPRTDQGIQMATEPLDVESLYHYAEERNGLDPRTVLGHIHLQVSDLGRSGAFYHDVLGFDITQRNFPGALFLSSGGYHHHIGLNIWRSRGASPVKSDTAGLDSFSIGLPSPGTMEAIDERAKRNGIVMTRNNDTSYSITDPDGILINLSADP
jgi:catechol 2,3-dioxygenase